jgi:hypothetical protein
MKKYLVALTIFYGFSAFGQFDQREKTYTCKVGALYYAPVAMQKSIEIQEIYRSTPPGSEQRKSALQSHEIRWDERLTKIYAQANANRQKMVEEKQITARLASYDEVISGLVKTLALKLSLTTPGRTLETYTRLLEEECLFQ